MIDKIPSYHIFNYLLPGILFVIIFDNITSSSFVQEDIVIGMFIYYFIGLTISRFGSLVLEPFLKKTSFLNFVDAEDFIRASRKDSQINIFSETNNMYRTFLSMFTLLSLIQIYQIISHKLLGLNNTTYIFILLILFLIMFLYSYKKQTDYITKRIEINNP